MIIKVYSRPAAVSFMEIGHSQNHYWISINDTVDEKLELSENVHYMTFSDIIPQVHAMGKSHDYYYTVETVAYNEDMAMELFNWVKSIPKDIDKLYIHCFAGQSRSQAIGLCLNIYFNSLLENNKEHFLHNIQEMPNESLPNPYVMTLTLKAMLAFVKQK